MLMKLTAGSFALAMLLLGAGNRQDDDKRGLRKKLKDKAADFWIYDDLDAGYSKARKTGKPLLVSFRCVP